eukprot:1195312-Prorocentrum_minimum.AAC.8
MVGSGSIATIGMAGSGSTATIGSYAASAGVVLCKPAAAVKRPPTPPLPKAASGSPYNTLVNLLLRWAWGSSGVCFSVTPGSSCVCCSVNTRGETPNQSSHHAVNARDHTPADSYSIRSTR